MSTTAWDRHKRLLPTIQGVPAFSFMGSPEREDLVEHCDFLRIAAGEIVFAEKDPPKGGYVVAAGRVAMRKRTFRGKEMVAELLGPNDCFGMVSAAQGMPYPLSAQALRESVVLTVEQDYLEALAGSSPSFLRHLLDVCSKRLVDAQGLIAHLADASSEIRIASALLLVAQKFGQYENGSARLDLTRDEIASIAGTTVETCIRVTRAFQQQGILLLPAPKQIEIVDLAALRRACSASA